MADKQAAGAQRQLLPGRMNVSGKRGAVGALGTNLAVCLSVVILMPEVLTSDSGDLPHSMSGGRTEESGGGTWYPARKPSPSAL